MMTARCATGCGIVSMGLPLSQAASPLYGNLSPASAGLFHAGPPRSAQPTARLGVGVVGLLRTGEIGKPVMATHNGRLAPLTPDAGLFLPVLLPRVQAPASEIRHRNQSRGSVLSCGLAGPLEIVGYLSGSVCIKSASLA